MKTKERTKLARLPLSLHIQLDRIRCDVYDNEKIILRSKGDVIKFLVDHWNGRKAWKNDKDLMD